MVQLILLGGCYLSTISNSAVFVFLLWPRTLTYHLDFWTLPGQCQISRRKVIVQTHTNLTDCSTWTTKVVGNKAHKQAGHIPFCFDMTGWSIRRLYSAALIVACLSAPAVPCTAPAASPSQHGHQTTETTNTAEYNTATTHLPNNNITCKM